MPQRIERRIGLAASSHQQSTTWIWFSVLLVAVLGAVSVAAANRYANTASDVNSAGQLRYRSLAIREFLAQQQFDLADTALGHMVQIRSQLQRRHGELAYFAEHGFEDFMKIAHLHQTPSFDITMRHVESADRLTSSLEQSAEGYMATTFVLFVSLFVVLAGTIANLLYVNSRLARAETNLHQLASTDGLTGLWNRRRLYSRLTDLQRGTPERREYCVILVDLDNFKWINDQYGHGRGDEVLAAFSAMLRSVDSGECHRYGGEEFAVIVLHRSLADATTIADTIRKNLERTQVAGLAVTASFGVARGQLSDSASSIMERADRALHVAKNGGRNRVANEAEAPRTKRSSKPRDISRES